MAAALCFVRCAARRAGPGPPRLRPPWPGGGPAAGGSGHSGRGLAASAAAGGGGGSELSQALSGWSDRLQRVGDPQQTLGRRALGEHEVIKVAGATGATSRYTATDRELLKEAGDGTLQIRDMHLVNPNARGQNMGFLVRQDSVLISLFGVKALLKSDACYLLEAQKPHVANTAVAIQLALGGREYREGRKPFELITLESLITSACSRLHHKVGQASSLVNIVLGDLETDPDSEGLRKIIPVKQKLESMRTRARAFSACFEETLADDEEMAGMNLTWKRENVGLAPPVEHHEEVETLLDIGRRNVDTLRRELAELSERVDDNREVVNISLDSQRNRILGINLYISLATLGITVVNFPAAFLGMNVPHGLEESPVALQYVSAGMAFSCAVVYAMFFSYMYGYLQRSQQKIKEHRALVNVLAYMDEIDQTFFQVASQQSVSVSEFKEALRQATGRTFSKEEMKLVARAYDDDDDDELHAATYARICDIHAIRDGKAAAPE